MTPESHASSSVMDCHPSHHKLSNFIPFKVYIPLFLYCSLKLMIIWNVCVRYFYTLFIKSTWLTTVQFIMWIPHPSYVYITPIVCPHYTHDQHFCQHHTCGLSVLQPSFVHITPTICPQQTCHLLTSHRLFVHITPLFCQHHSCYI